ncbi:MAG: AMP-binding protein [Clostridia bacterium]|nr:AMP-binding protein [Clostridia bacterium]
MAFYTRLVQADTNSYESFVNTLKIDVPEDFNFAYDVLDVLAEETPDNPAMLWLGKDGEERRYTYSDVSRESSRAAHFFRELGIRRGDRVLLVCKRHFRFWFAIMALHKLGAIAIPATHLLKAKDFEYRNNLAGVSAVVCTADDDTADEIDLAAPNCPTLKHKIIVCGTRPGWRSMEETQAYPDVFPRPTDDQRTHNDDGQVLFFTSGTTGMPKMVLHDCTYPLGHIITSVYWQEVQEGGLHLTVADTGWGKALWGKLYGQWMAGCCVFIYDFDRFHAADLLEKIEKYKVTSFCAPPTIYRYFLQEDLTKYDLSALKHGSIAGEALNPEIFAQFKELTGLSLTEAFGQTETVVSLGTFTMMTPQPGSMGKPSPLYDVFIADDEGNPQPRGQVGEICIRIKNNQKPLGMFHSYYGDPERTKAAVAGGIYRTGDQAWQDEAGYYWYVGRADDVIKSSGYRIGPFEVESALIEHPAVLEAAVTAVPDPVRGQIVKATIVLKEGYEPSDALVKELQNHVKRITAPYKYPRVIAFVDELPKTISGKIRRVEIRQADRN